MMIVTGNIVTIDAIDIITTIAGDGTASSTGDNGQASSATLNYPRGVATDSTGKNTFCTLFSSTLKLKVFTTSRQCVHR